MKAVVVAGGEAVDADRRHLLNADLIVAADSGARWLISRGTVPELVIGDFDSTPAELLDELRQLGARLEPHPRAKEASDTELAVSRAIELGARSVIVIAALGGKRLDHELANVMLLAEPAWAGIDLRLVRGETTVRALHSGQELRLEAGPGELVTLLPIGEADGIVTDGLRYALDGDPLPLGRSRGLSNVVERAPASVRLERGSLLVVEVPMEGDR